VDVRTLALIGMIALAGCGDGKDGDTGEVDRVTAVLALTGDTTNGKTLYDSVCTVCHGANGEGGTGNVVAPVADDEVFVATVIEGRVAEGMAAYGDDYTDQEIADILAHVKTLSGVAP